MDQQFGASHDQPPVATGGFAPGHPPYLPPPPKAPSGPATIGGFAVVLALVLTGLFFVLLIVAAQDATGELRTDLVMITAVGTVVIGALVGLVVGAIVFAVRRSRYTSRYNRYLAQMQAAYPYPPHQWQPPAASPQYGPPTDF